jgi:hypothetical protein
MVAFHEMTTPKVIYPETPERLLLPGELSKAWRTYSPPPPYEVAQHEAGSAPVPASRDGYTQGELFGDPGLTGEPLP